MTTTDETVKTAKKDKAAAGGGGILLDIIATLAVTALVTWVAGVAFHQGFGVSIPFAGAWLLFLVTLTVIKLATTELAGAWHTARVKADVTLLAASLAAQESLTFQHFEKRIGETSGKVDGGYL